MIDTLEKNYSRAERDNDLIYHHDIPPFSSLPTIQEISMVQSNVPPGLQDPRTAIGNEGVIFGDLVGWGARVAVGEYAVNATYDNGLLTLPSQTFIEIG